MTLFSQAIAYATQMHEGMCRKGSDVPYIVHPMEAAAIAATLTDDQEILAAAVLHDVMEDCGVSMEELTQRFGARVASIVLSETQLCVGDPYESWESRKAEALEKIAAGDRAVKIVALSDKLSNMRAIGRDYRKLGEALFFRFHQHDKRRHAWYYQSCMELLECELGASDAYKEFCAHVRYVFMDVSAEPYMQQGDAYAV